MALAAFARAARAVLQRRRHVRARVLDDRDRAKQQAGADRDRQREQQHDRIERDLVQPRQLRRLQVDEQLDAAVGERGADGAADQRDDQRLRHQLPGHAPGFGAEREADRQLLLPRLGAHQEQVGDVRARDQQHEADRAEQNPQHRADVADHINSSGRTSDPNRASSNIFCVKPGGSGKRSVSDGSNRSTSALACAMVTPGLSRARPW